MTKRRFTRRSVNDLLKVGVITGAGGHCGGVWGEKLNPTADNIRTTGMVMTQVWSIHADWSKQFAEKFDGVEVVDDPRDMIGEIDGFFLDDITAISLYPILVRPFLEAGIPTLVNRPFATSMAKGRQMVEMAEAHGAAITTFSTWEFCEAAADVRAKVAEMPAINGYVGHNSMSDFYTHGIHGAWFSHAVLRDEMARGRGRLTGAAYHSPNWRVPGGLIVYEHENGDRPPYYGALNEPAGADGQAYIRVFGDHSGDAEGKIPGRPGYFMYNTWNAGQLALQEMFETGVPIQPHDELITKLEMFLLPFYSVLEKGGNMARPEELGSWELPRPSEELMLDRHPTDSAFRDLYTDAELEAVEKLFEG